jgi:NAD(P)-dependent dehydrogenase (short-subunit alcohol dehydrogenase family)
MSEHPNQTIDVPKRAVIVGASRGLGRGIAVGLHDAGIEAISVSRTAATSREPVLVEELGDARDRQSTASTLRRNRPDLLVIAAGAVPGMGPLQDQSWETFSVNFDADVRITFEWTSAALRAPLAPGSRVIVISSGAALRGSRPSGGYSGAKATQRFIATFARGESADLGLDISVTTVLPTITPHGAVGRVGIDAHAVEEGLTVDEYIAGLGPLITPEVAGAAMNELARTPRADLAPEYLLTGAGLRELA